MTNGCKMSLCSDQSTFNNAVSNALDNYTKKKAASNKVMVVIAIIYFILLFWALNIAMHIPDKSHRTLHIFFSIVSPPVYLIAHYL